MPSWWQRVCASKACLFALLVSLAPMACRAQPQVAVYGEGGRKAVFQVEIADTPEKRELGLQYRRELPASHGMLFIFPDERDNAFWMKNTPIPLDMIFISRERTIIGIIENTIPYSLESRSVGTPSQYVLEINGGLSRRYGIRVGDAIRFENIGRPEVRP